MMQRQDYSEKLNILVIEDNQGDFVLIEDYLIEKFKRIEIIHRSDFKHSINYLQNAREEVSLILLDLNLPDLEGIELIKGILACAHEVPIIVLTGYSDLEMAEKSLQIGISDYLVKDKITSLLKVGCWNVSNSLFLCWYD